MDRHGAAHVLEQIASYLELKGENEFKVRAFRNAAHAVATYAGDFSEAVRTSALGDEKGIGPATLEVVRECVSTGRSAVLESLRREVPAGLIEILRIGGLGVQKTRAIHELLGISTVAELEVAARDGRLAALPRFGVRTAERVLRGIAFLRRTGERRLFHHALRQAEQLRSTMLALGSVRTVEIAGSIRRRCEVIRDVDLVVGTDAGPEAVEARVESLPGVKDVVGTGDAAFTVHFEDDTSADIYCARPDTLGHAMLWATGSAAHLEMLSKSAVDWGFNLEARGLFRNGEPVGCPDEATLYRALGLPWIPPELREGRGEVARAREGRLPRLVERADLVGFVHCHTNYSDGTNTVAELADACRAEGYRYLGVTDHSEAAAFAGGLREDSILRQHEEIDSLNRSSPDLLVLKGVEADILGDGTLDYGPEFLNRFDFVIGSVHNRLDMDEKKMTERILMAMDDPHFAIMGHPTGRLLLSREPYPMDMARIITYASERGIALEINADPQRLDLDWRLCEQAKAAGIPISIGADAHNLAGLANVDIGIGIARKAGLEKADILNTRDADGFLAHAQARRSR